MGAINLDIITLPKGTNESSTTYADLRLDLKLDYTLSVEFGKEEQIRDVQANYDVSAITTAMINLLTTSPGEKILNPLFGINFGDLLFLPVTGERASTIGSTIISTMERFEPRIKVLNLEITPVIESQEYICDFTYNIPRFNNATLNLKGNLSQTGFTV